MKIIYLITGLLRDYELKYKNIFNIIDEKIPYDIYCITWNILVNSKDRNNLNLENRNVSSSKLCKFFKTKYVRIYNFDDFRNLKEKEIENYSNILRKNLPDNYHDVYFQNLYYRFYLINKGLNLIQKTQKIDDIFIISLRFDTEIKDINYEIIKKKNYFLVNNYYDNNKSIFSDLIFSSNYKNMRLLCNLINFIIDDWEHLNINKKMITENIITFYLNILETNKKLNIEANNYIEFIFKNIEVKKINFYD